MKTITATLQSISAFSFGKVVRVEKKDRELPDAFEKRTWRERCHYDEKTHECFIPPMMFKNAIAEAAKYMSIQVPGKGKNTFTKHFEAGVLVLEPLMLGVKMEDIQSEEVYVPADGRRGGTRRVWKIFPVVHEWKGEVTYTILDEIITKEIFIDHLVASGNFIGLGRWRPRNNGLYGRFKVVNVGDMVTVVAGFGR